MRLLLVSALVSVTALQASLQTDDLRSALLHPAFLALALGVITTAYNFGSWRKGVDNAKHDVSAQLKQFQDSTAQSFVRVDGRFDGIQRQLTVSQDQHAAGERWKGAMESRVDALAERLDRFEPREVV